MNVRFTPYPAVPAWAPNPFLPQAGPAPQFQAPTETFQSGGSAAIDPFTHFRRLSEQMADYAKKQARRQQPTTEMVKEMSRRSSAHRQWPAVDPKATVAVIDDFAVSSDGFSHGDAVCQVLRRSGNLSEEQIQRFDTRGPLHASMLMFDGPDSPRERLEGYIELSALETMRQTNSLLAHIGSAANSQIRTISQSQGWTRLSSFQLIEHVAYDSMEPGNIKLSDSGKSFYAALGLPPEPSKENSLAFTHRLAAEVDRVISNSEEIRAEQNIHEQLTSALRARGINYVVSAGNDGEDVREFPEFFNERFDDHLLASRNAVIVGAIDTRGTADFSDDRVADFSSDYEQVAYLADGVDVPVQSNGQTIQVSGTSFSAPFVAGKLAAISLQHPEYSAPQTLAVLDESAFSPVAGSTLPVIR